MIRLRTPLVSCIFIAILVLPLFASGGQNSGVSQYFEQECEVSTEPEEGEWEEGEEEAGFLPIDGGECPPVSPPPIVGFTLGYALKGEDSLLDPSYMPWVEPPLLGPFDRNDQNWWNSMIHEAGVGAEAHFVAPVIRGFRPDGITPPGDSSPKLLYMLRKAIINRSVEWNRTGAGVEVRVAPFLDIAALPHLKAALEKGVTSIGSALISQTAGLSKSQAYGVMRNAAMEGTSLDFPNPIDLSSEEDARIYFWELCLREFFIQIPENQLLTIDGKVLVFLWSNAPALGFINHYLNEGESSLNVLEYLRERARKEFGYELYFNLDSTWPRWDSTITPANVEGVNDWFVPSNLARPNYSIYQWRGRSFAVAVPGFRDPPHKPLPHTIVERRGGETLRLSLRVIEAAKPVVLLLEGLTDIEESAGYYRSNFWTLPDGSSHQELYLGLIRDLIRRTREP